MKRLLSLVFLFLLVACYSSAQVNAERCWHLEKMQFLDHRQDFWKSYKIFTAEERPNARMGGGMYSHTVVQYGFGLYIIEPPFAHHVTGVTTALGWSYPGGFALGGGTGFLKYNDGYTVPLYADLRYIIGRQKVKFFIAMPAGFLLNFDNFRDYSKVFANPSLGLTVPIFKETHISFSTGLFTQIDREIFDDPSFNAPWHDSFINLKLGLLFGW
ncbi:MAG TPA: hypothetical protein PKE28_02025 [Bacteroidales bacterium]|nr:hypothetical protein [Bacteroidales bacterium]HMT66351.1 hypothetical protein [Bacteroidales bacterium]